MPPIPAEQYRDRRPHRVGVLIFVAASKGGRVSLVWGP